MPSGMDKQLHELAMRLYVHGMMVADKMQTTAGGDAYVFTGSMNDIDELREVLHEFRWSPFNTDKDDDEDAED